MNFGGWGDELKLKNLIREFWKIKILVFENLNYIKAFVFLILYYINICIIKLCFFF